MPYWLCECHDIFFVSERIKEINPDYHLFFNMKDGRFEVWKTGDKCGLAMVVHNPVVDARIIEDLNKTRIHNIEKIVLEIETHNEKIQEQQIQDTLNKVLI